MNELCFRNSGKSSAHAVFNLHLVAVVVVGDNKNLELHHELMSLKLWSWMAHAHTVTTNT